MTPQTFAAILQDRLSTIDHALAQIERGELVEPALHSLRCTLIEVLEQVERDPGIEAAADDLYTAAATLSANSAKGVPPEARQLRLLQPSELPSTQAARFRTTCFGTGGGRKWRTPFNAPVQRPKTPCSPFNSSDRSAGTTLREGAQQLRAWSVADWGRYCYATLGTFRASDRSEQCARSSPRLRPTGVSERRGKPA